MFSGIHSRLIASYVVVILVALAVAFGALLLVTRPLQSRVTQTVLRRQVSLIGPPLDQALRRGVPVGEILARVQQREIRTNRLLIVTPAGEVLADSAGRWLGQRVSPVAGQGGRPPPDGELQGPEGDSWLYASTPLESAGQPLLLLAVARTPRTYGSLVADLGLGFLTAGAIALFLSIVLAALIARSVAAPLQHIARTAESVANGEYGQRAPDEGPDEVRRVARSFNLMIERLQAGQQAMRDFVSNVSHDLKTPLTSIQGFAQALLEGATSDEAARRRAAGIIFDESSRMVRMVEDLLDLARIDSGEIVMARTPLDLASLLGLTVDKLGPQAAQQQVTLVRQWGQLSPVVGDGDRLAQVFTNLLDNAIKHTPPGGQVTVSSRIVPGPARRPVQRPVTGEASTAVSRRASFAEISVADTGAGIPAEDLPRIFERFYQVDKSRRRGRGTGLGLVIVREIVEAHGGYVRAESVEGVGSKFTVGLPLTEADVATRVARR